MGTKMAKMSFFVMKYVRKSLFLIVYRIPWKHNEFNEEMCKKIVWNVVQNIQRRLQIFVVIFVKW